MLKEPGQREHRVIGLQHSQPITFGANREYGVVHDPATGGLTVRPIAEAGIANVLVHDATQPDPSVAFALSRLTGSDLAHTVTGVFRSITKPTYDDQARAQVAKAAETKAADLAALLHGKDTWTVVG